VNRQTNERTRPETSSDGLGAAGDLDPVDVGRGGGRDLSRQLTTRKSVETHPFHLDLDEMGRRLEGELSRPVAVDGHRRRRCQGVARGRATAERRRRRRRPERLGPVHRRVGRAVDADDRRGEVCAISDASRLSTTRSGAFRRWASPAPQRRAGPCCCSDDQHRTRRGPGARLGGHQGLDAVAFEDATRWVRSNGSAG